jgi:ABC-2 type transport system permease protein
MTTAASAPAPADVSAAPRAVSPYRLTFGHLIASEWIKLTTLRSTWWALAVSVVLSLVFSLALGFVSMVSADEHLAAGEMSPATVVLVPLMFTTLVGSILGAIVVTGEYGSGMIRATFTAAPRRGAVLLAKAIAVSVLVAATTIVTLALAILVTAPMLTPGFDWSTPDQSIQPLAFGVLCMIAITLIGVGVGFVVRSSAAAISFVVGLLFVLVVVIGFIGDFIPWVKTAAGYIPLNLLNTLTSPGITDPTSQLIALAAWVVVALGAGWVVVRTRDA